MKMLRSIMLRVATGLTLSLIASPLAAQQSVSASVSTAIGRARSLMDAGDGDAARTLLDSLATQTASGSDDRAESLYWRGVLSEKVADAERDWKMLVIEAPLAPRVPDALIRLSELEILRGQPSSARPHLERLLRDFGDAPQKSKALVLIARSYFEERDDTRACAAVNRLRDGDVPEGEIRLQAEELGRRCRTAATAVGGTTGTAVGGTTTTAVAGTTTTAVAGTTTTAVAGTTTTAVAGTTTTAVAGTSTAVDGTTSTAVAVPTTAVAVTAFSVQLAAYDTKAQATSLVNRLSKRGIKARIDGTRKPFRVRVGRYNTRAAATAALARLKKQGQNGFVAEIPR